MLNARCEEGYTIKASVTLWKLSKVLIPSSVMKDVDLLRNIALISGKGFQKGSLSEKHEIPCTSLTPTTHLTVFARDDAVFADTESAVCAQS